MEMITATVGDRPVTRRVGLDAIAVDAGVQPRAQINQTAVIEYAEEMRAGAVFPPLVLYDDGERLWLSEGFHRYHGARYAGLAELEAEVRPGTRADAVLHAAGSNARHGIRRTNEDKRRAVLRLLVDPTWSRWSDREIARRCAVDNAFVSRLRAALSVDGQQMGTIRLVERAGVTYPMDTAAIGGASAEEDDAFARGLGPVDRPLERLPGLEEVPLDDVLDDEAQARLARSRTRAAFADGVAACSRLMLLGPDAIFDSLDRAQAESALSFVVRMRSWLVALEAAGRRGIRVVASEEV